MVIDAEHGTIDSPMHPSQVSIKPGAKSAVAQLSRWGVSMAVCTNQPAAAKGKTTLENLKQAHTRVLDLAGLGSLNNSYLCLHRAEEGCQCRKPKPGMLLEALSKGNFDLSNSWMVGDGITDVQAGKSAGLKTAFLGAKRPDIIQALIDNQAEPDIHAADLIDFVSKLADAWQLKLDL